MTAQPIELQYRPLRAPREDRTALIEPPLGDVGLLVDENVRLRAQADYDLQGRRLSQMIPEAREELLREARRYTSAYRDVAGRQPDAGDRIFLAGHQPQLFHPGVWLKNFALGYLARCHRATAVNLVIDSDTIKGSGLLVPGGSRWHPHLEVVPFDRPDGKTPYEERPVLDRRTFVTFGARVREHLAPLVPDPLVDHYWPLVLRRFQQTGNLGECLAQSRHQLEGQWGVESLEIPQSRVCDCESFCWFVAHLLAQLPRLSRTHNESVREYRRTHGIRGTAHPVPDLARDGQWLEAPLWIWTADDPHRQRLFARQIGGRMLLANRRGWEQELPLTADGDAGRAAERLVEWNRQGVKIRSRALITTLWARLVLGDLFLHGIGGAKYDQVTDLLIARFFGLAAPGFMVVSGTLQLPIPREPVSEADARAIRQRLRELTYHPERYLEVKHSQGEVEGVSAEPAELVATKNRWIQTPVIKANARTRARAIRAINETLQPWVEAQRLHWQQLQTQTAQALHAERILGSREYGFCLYPERSVREFLGRVLPKLS